MDTLLQESDFVCLILLLTDETYHLFDAEQFAKMKSSAVSLMPDVARGLRKCTDCRIAEGKFIAGLDVSEQEPLVRDSLLLSLANRRRSTVHIGSATHETRYGMAACAG